MDNFYYSLASGSSGNCGLLALGGTYILIDLGVSVRRLTALLGGLGLTIDDLDAVLLTHEHIDHIKGMATFVKRHSVPLYTAIGTAEALLSKFPQANDQLRPFYSGANFTIGNVKVYAFPTPHDAAESTGYRFEADGMHVGYATDLGFVPTPVREALLGCSTVVLESNHDPEMLRTGPYPYALQQRVAGPRGHLSNPDCAKLAVELVQNGTSQLILAHLSDKNNTPGHARLETEAALRAAGLSCTILVAPKDEMEQPLLLTREEACVCCPSA